MVWGFLRRRRRAPSVAGDVSGLYRRTEAGAGSRGEAEGGLEAGGEELGPGPPPPGPGLTWDTLKRLRRQASQVVRRPSLLPSPVVVKRRARGMAAGADRRRPVSLQPSMQREGERFQSTPCVFRLGAAVSCHQPVPPSVLRFTSWEKHKSVITLNFDEEQEQEEEEEEEEEEEQEEEEGELELEERRWDSQCGEPTSGHYCDSDSRQLYCPTTPPSGLHYCPTSASGLNYCPTTPPSGLHYCDSDSGVSSLYESIPRPPPAPAAIQDCLDTSRLEPALREVLARGPRLHYSSALLEVSFQLPCLVPREEAEVTADWQKAGVLGLLGRQGDQLQEALGAVTAQLEGVERSLEEVEAALVRSGADYRQVRRARACLARIEPLASLTLGLELRQEEGGGPGGGARLKEASVLGRRQEVEVAGAEALVGARLGVSARLSFRRSVQQRKRLVCELRAVERELRALEARRKVVNLCGDI